MKIKEVCQQTGLTRRTIRFYEAEKLFAPEKTYQNGREFRNYSEENIQQLQKIATLRRARFSVDEIRRMKESPEETTAIFRDYRERLRLEKADLEQILAFADAIADEELASADDLVSRMKAVTRDLPLPAVDVRPHFRYLDAIADSYAESRNRKAQQEKQRREDIELALHTSVSAAAYRKSCARELGPGNEQKFAILQMLQNEKDEMR